VAVMGWRVLLRLDFLSLGMGTALTSL